MYKLIWNLFHKQLIPYYIRSQVKPVNFSELELAHTDTEGRNYYRFPKSMSLPIERFGKLQEFIMWMSAGLSGDELDKLIDSADIALTEGLKTGKNAAKIGSILSQIRERKGMVIHTELLYNYLAVQLIRSDENPLVFDNEIQMQKVEQFKKDTELNPGFFFRHPELSRLQYLFQMSKDEWIAYWQESKTQQKILNESLKLYQSKSESNSTVSNGNQTK